MQTINVLELKDTILNSCEKQMTSYNVDLSLQALIMDAIAGEFQKKVLEKTNQESFAIKLKAAKEEENAEQRKIDSDGSD